MFGISPDELPLLKIDRDENKGGNCSELAATIYRPATGKIRKIYTADQFRSLRGAFRGMAQCFHHRA